MTKGRLTGRLREAARQGYSGLNNAALTPGPAPNGERNSEMAVKWDFNMGTLIPVGIALFTGAMYINTQLTSLEARLTQSEQFRAQRTAQTDNNFVNLTSAIRSMQTDINKQVGTTENLNYRMGQNEASLKAANERMDRIADSVLSSVDSIKRDISGLTTKFEVMNQKIDSLDVPRTRGPRS